MTNAEVRKWYLSELAKVPVLNEEWERVGVTLKARAHMAWAFRHNTRLEARAKMEDPNDVELLRRGYVKKYGNPDGPTFSWLIAKLKAHGITGDDALTAIIEGSHRSNEEINKLLGL